MKVFAVKEISNTYQNLSKLDRVLIDGIIDALEAGVISPQDGKVYRGLDYVCYLFTAGKFNLWFTDWNHGHDLLLTQITQNSEALKILGFWK